MGARMLVGVDERSVFCPGWLQVQGCDIEASWAGGEDGRRVIDLFLPKIKVR